MSIGKSHLEPPKFSQVPEESKRVGSAFFFFFSFFFLGLRGVQGGGGEGRGGGGVKNFDKC
jgi:hypothetical protein